MQISSQSQAPASLNQVAAATRAAAPATVSNAERVGRPAHGAPEGAPPPRPLSAASEPDQMASNLARLDSFMEAAMERLQNAVSNAPADEVTSFREAAEALESGFSRLREGMANGTLAPEDIQRGVRNTFQGARELLEAARPAVDEGAAAASVSAADVAPASVTDASEDAAGTGETVRARYGSFTESVLGRIAGLEDMDAETASAVEEAAAAFESATARLDQALFNPVSGDPIHRGT
ncbi:MAG: hypothetical protein AAGG01_11825, partial [Planctomycetota bacterium]